MIYMLKDFHVSDNGMWEPEHKLDLWEKLAIAVGMASLIAIISEFTGLTDLVLSFLP